MKYPYFQIAYKIQKSVVLCSNTPYTNSIYYNYKIITHYIQLQDLWTLVNTRRQDNENTTLRWIELFVPYEHNRESSESWTRPSRLEKVPYQGYPCNEQQVKSFASKPL